MRPKLATRVGGALCCFAIGAAYAQGLRDQYQQQQQREQTQRNREEKEHRTREAEMKTAIADGYLLKCELGKHLFYRGKVFFSLADPWYWYKQIARYQRKGDTIVFETAEHKSELDLSSNTLYELHKAQRRVLSPVRCEVLNGAKTNL